MSSVDWSHPQPHTRTVKGKQITEPRFVVTCSCCEMTRLSKKCDAQKVEKSGSPCQRCANVIKGKAGYAATAAKKGALWVQQKAREKRLLKPSNLEKIVISILDEEAVSYRREVSCGPYYIDFVIGNQAIEVEGAYFHSLRDPQAEADRYAIIRQHYQLLILREANAASFRSLIQSFMEMPYVSSRKDIHAYA